MTGVTAMIAAGAVNSQRGGSRVSITVPLNADQIGYNFTASSAATYGPYVAGQTDVTLEISSNVYVYSDSVLLPALSVGTFTPGDTVTIINNGFIIGCGGAGASGSHVTQTTAATAGGRAITVGGFNIRLTNNGYIAGGGGGGGSSAGGGGAGGGAGGNFLDGAGSTLATGGAGGNRGGPGNNGAVGVNGNTGSGAGGGRMLPGTGGAAGVGLGDGLVGQTVAQGGGAGGGAGSGTGLVGPGTLRTSAGGGGGGWGAAGGAGQQKVTGPEYSTSIAPGSGGSSNSAGSNGTVAGAATPTDYSGAAGGKAIHLNGEYTVTYLTVGTIYGAVS